MNVAINLDEIIKDNEFSKVVSYLINNGNKVYLVIDNSILKNNEIHKKLHSLKNINFTDTIFYTSQEQLSKIYSIKNINYIIDSKFNTNLNVPLIHMCTNNDNGATNLNNAKEVLNHFLDYKKCTEQSIKNPVTAMTGVPSIDKIWNRQYTIAQKNINLQNMSIYDYILLNNKDNMNSVALRYFGKTMTFKEMFEKIDEVAKSLKVSDINEGDVVTICMPNTVEGVIAFFAINKIGAVASMLHPLLKGNDILETLQTTKSKYMIMADMCYSEVDKILTKTYLEKVVVVSPSTSMPILGGIPNGIKMLYILNERFKILKSKCNVTKLSLVKTILPKQYIHINEEVSKEISTLDDKLVKIDYDKIYVKWNDEIKEGMNYTGDISSKYIPQSTAALLRTGGTTGVSKLASLTNENIINNTAQLRDTIPSYKKGDELLAISPIFHGFGLVDSVITALAVNMSVDLHPQYNKSIFVKSLLKNKPTLVLGVPTLFKSLIHNKVFNGKDLSFLKVLISGGDTLDANLRIEIDEWLKKHNAPNPIFSGFGLTEATAAISFTGLNSKNNQSVGYPLPLNNIKVIDPVTKQELGYEEVGELCISGPTVMKEYYQNNQETNNTFLPENKAWLRTGDMCYITRNGEICFVDRNKNVIIVSGVNVYSNEIETILLQVPEIDTCAVIGIPHSYKMNVPKAYVVLKDGIVLDENMKRKILEVCNSKLDSYHKIYDIEQIDSIPLTNLNKVNYNELRKIETKPKTKIKN